MDQTIRCPNCGSLNTTGQKFCGSCGLPIGNSCPNCGANLDSNDRFCGNCGAQMPAQSPPQQQQPPPYQQQPPPYQQQAPYQQQSPYQQQTQYNPQQGWTEQQQRAYGPQGGMPYQGAYAAGTPKRQSRMPLIILLMVLVIALGGFAYWAFMGSPPWSGGGSVTITTGPFIQAVSDNTSETRDVTITWETNTDSTGKIEYGADTSYGSSSQWESGATKNHSVELTGLTPDTRYHYRVINSKSGNEVQSSDYTFSTPQ